MTGPRSLHAPRPLQEVPRTLPVLVRDRMDTLGVTSIRQLAARCGIAKETARRILSGIGTTEESTLRALAAGLALPLPVLRLAAGRPAGVQAPFRLPPAFDQLDEQQRAVLVGMGWALLRAGTHRKDESRRVVIDAVAHDVTFCPPVPLVGRTREPDGPAAR